MHLSAFRPVRLPGGIPMPVSNLEYDIMTVLQSKLEALAAYEEYLDDCEEDESCQRLLEEIARDDERHLSPGLTV